MKIIQTVAIFASVCGLAAWGLSACGPAASPSETDIDPVTVSPYVSASDQTIKVGDQRLRYRDTGPKDAPVIVMLHGFTDSLHSWDLVADALDTDFRVIRPDLPGHGLSGAVAGADASNEATVMVIHDFLRQVGVSDPILVGNSLGGLIAWRLAAANPDAVSGLILLAPGGVPHNGVSEDPLPVPVMLRLYLNSAPKAGVRAALQALHADPTRVTEADVIRYRDLMQPHGEDLTLRAAQFTLPEPTQDLARIAVPTTIIWGDKDVMLPSDQADIFRQTISGATVERLPNIGHLPQIEAPDQVVQAVRNIAAQVRSK